jgi:hypothetical protein
MSCPETWKMRTKFVNNKSQHINEAMVYNKIFRCTNKNPVVTLGRHVDKVKYKWINKVKEL